MPYNIIHGHFDTQLYPKCQWYINVFPTLEVANKKGVKHHYYMHVEIVAH